MKKIRTTIVLPETDLRLIKMQAVLKGTTMSQVIQDSVRQAVSSPLKSQNKGWKSVVGTLDLGAKAPSSRQKLYDKYLKQKFSS